MQLGIDRGTCWKNEYKVDKSPHGARRRSIRIDTPAEGKGDDLDHCLWMYKNGDKTCSGRSFDTMSFSQSGTSVSVKLRIIGHDAHTTKFPGPSATHSIRATKIPI